MKDIKILEIMELFDEGEVIPASQMQRPQSALDREMFQDANIRLNKAGGGMLVQPSFGGTRQGYAKAKSVQKLGPRNIIQQLGVGNEILEMYKQGAGTIEIGKKYGIGKDTVNRFIKQTNPNLLRESLPKVNQYNFDYSIIDKIKEDAKTMSRKEILKKYEGKISKKKLDSLKLNFGKVEESGRPRIPEGERSPKLVKRANRIKTVQGFDVSGSFLKNFHHIFPIGGKMKLNPNDVMILDKKFNEILGGFNLRLNDIADEIVTLDFSDPDSLKKLNDLNAESKAIIARAKAKLPKNLQNVIGYVEYQPVFDSNGTIVELSYVRRGVDQSPDTFKNFGVKNFTDFSKEERSLFKKEIKNAAKFAEETGKTSLKLNQVKGLAAFMKKLGIKCQLANGINCNMPQAYEKSLNQLSKASYTGDSAAAAKMTNFAKSVRGAGSIVKGVLGPAALAWEVGVGVPLGLFEYAQGKPADEIINSLTYGLAGTDRETKLKEIFPEYGQGDALEKTYKGFLSTLNKLGEIRDPESLRPGKQITMEDVMKKAQPFERINPQLDTGKFFDLDMFKKNIEESRAVEQKLAEEDLQRKEQRTTDPFTAYSDDFMAAGGGIAGLSGGIDEGPQIRSMNPDSGGLKGLLNRVKKQ